MNDKKNIQGAKDTKDKKDSNIVVQLQTQRRTNRLNSIKNELEAGKMNSFDQMFAIMSETRISIELGISFYAFRKKVNDPGEFTLNELIRFASLVGVKYDVMANFVWDRIKAKSKSRIFRS